MTEMEGGEGRSSASVLTDEAVHAFVRGELAASIDGSRRALLLVEHGLHEERAGRGDAARQAFREALGIDPDLAEAREGWLRVSHRDRSGKPEDLPAIDIAGLHDADKRARWLLADASILEKGELARTVTETADAASQSHDQAALRLIAEMLAARAGDDEARTHALGARVEHATDGEWRDLLTIDQAQLLAKQGEVDRAAELLLRVTSGDSPAAFRASVALEALLLGEPGLPGSEEATQRASWRAQSLERQLELAKGEGASGMPTWAKAPTFVMLTALRAADMHLRRGDPARAARLLDAWLDSDGADDAIGETIIVRRRIRLAELTGDTSRAAALAERIVPRFGDSPFAGALWMHVAEQAASNGDVPAALSALSHATQVDPVNIPARALQLDLLSESSTEFATELAALAEKLTTAASKARAELLVAYAWARCADAERARAALERARDGDFGAEALARFGRLLASLTGDKRWQEDATAALLAAGGDADEAPQWWFELARTRLRRGDVAEARIALQKLGTLPDGAWLGRVLLAFLPDGDASADQRREAIEDLSQVVSDGETAKALTLLAALRALSERDFEAATHRLRKVLEDAPGDVLASTLLAEVLREQGDVAGAADAYAATAQATDDARVAASLHMQAGLLRFLARDGAGALRCFESMAAASPNMAPALARWVAYACDLPNATSADDSDLFALVARFASEVAEGHTEAAQAAVEALEMLEGSEDLVAALCRLVSPLGAADPALLRRALSQLEQSAGAAGVAAAVERARMALGNDATEREAAMEAWFEKSGSLAAALEWLASTIINDDRKQEAEVRLRLAEKLPAPMREAMVAQAALAACLRDPESTPALLSGVGPLTSQVNMELAHTGDHPLRRARGLSAVDPSLGEEAHLDARLLAAWGFLAAQHHEEALGAFREVTAKRPRDLAAWDGLLTTANLAGDTHTAAGAAETMAGLCVDDERASALWEEAGLLWLERQEPERAERALENGFARNGAAASVFDKLFRLVRERKDHDKLLSLVARRLEFTDDPKEMTKLYWEQARALRSKGETEEALLALENVTMLEPDHVGALALTGEIFIRLGRYEEAASSLSRLAKSTEAPAKNRATAAVAAVDLYEKKLGRHDDALEVLVALHKAGLTTLPVRERLARAAARTGAWKEATAILEELMEERPESSGRMEAARLAMAIYRDKLQEPDGALRATLKLLTESPGDPEALEMLLRIRGDAGQKQLAFTTGLSTTLRLLQDHPADLAAVHRVCRMAEVLRKTPLERVAVSTALALGGPDEYLESTFAKLTSKLPRAPETALTDQNWKKLAAPGDDGPFAELFMALGPTLSEAFGPSLASLGITKRDRVDPRTGLALRNEVAAWAGAFGISVFELYVGGKDASLIAAIPGEPPCIVMGADTKTPLSIADRGRLARELAAVARGTSIMRSRDDTTVAAIIVAACRLADVPIDAPPYAVLGEVEKLLGRALARKTRKAIFETCRAIASKKASDARIWSSRALGTHSRAALVATADMRVALTDVMPPTADRADAVKHDTRVHELIRFALSPVYLELRSALGLEGAS